MSALECENIKNDDPRIQREERLICYEKTNQKLLEYTSLAIKQTLFTDQLLVYGDDNIKEIIKVETYFDNFQKVFPFVSLLCDKNTPKKEKTGNKCYNSERINMDKINNLYITKENNYTIQRNPDYWNYLLKRITELLNDTETKARYENIRKSILQNVAKIILLFLFQSRIIQGDTIVIFENLAQSLNDIFVKKIKEPLKLEYFDPYFVQNFAINVPDPDATNRQSQFYRGIIAVLKKNLEDTNLTGEALADFNKEQGIGARYDIGSSAPEVVYSTGNASAETYANDPNAGEEKYGFEEEVGPFDEDGDEAFGGGKRLTRKRKQHFRSGTHFSKKHFSKKCHKTSKRKSKKTMKRKYKKTSKRKSNKTLKRKHIRRRTSSTV
jgi:hypothetical protein